MVVYPAASRPKIRGEKEHRGHRDCNVSYPSSPIIPPKANQGRTLIVFSGASAAPANASPTPNLGKLDSSRRSTQCLTFLPLSFSRFLSRSLIHHSYNRQYHRHPPPSLSLSLSSSLPRTPLITKISLLSSLSSLTFQNHQDAESLYLSHPWPDKWGALWNYTSDPSFLND